MCEAVIERDKTWRDDCVIEQTKGWDGASRASVAGRPNLAPLLPSPAAPGNQHPVIRTVRRSNLTGDAKEL